MNDNPNYLDLPLPAGFTVKEAPVIRVILDSLSKALDSGDFKAAFTRDKIEVTILISVPLETFEKLVEDG